ncbi:hypothetical protein G5B37_10700 [Rasiella rasia]|uniref:Uncharacterized protein n=1 Tax=Rasiella rasia TaxID=2744027 RepID=A0A6G6GN53_9FLAO|nr:hypothetical protein [Rasiella rasia]QIE60015.1 hypothetical protein G5B37_10700 [Rasiella rasia]
MKTRVAVLLVMLFLPGMAYFQTDADFEKIQYMANFRIHALKQGNIENLKGQKPAEGTWNYQHLIAYKEALKEERNIVYGSYIEKVRDKDNHFAYNYFAIETDGKNHRYYFVAIFEFDISQEFNIVNSYLFTYPESLKSWWMHTAGMYKYNLLKDIPEKYVYTVCPPPPFSEE